MQPYPAPDHGRESRLVKDIADLLHEPCVLDEGDNITDMNPLSEARFRRWIRLLLEDIQQRRRWWFLDNATTPITLSAGQDVIDIRGDVDKIIKVYAPLKLHQESLGAVTDWRMDAIANSRPNAGRVQRYAIESGRRIHLQPAPAEDSLFAVLYARPIEPAILPRNWDNIILDGVIGKYGRHFDRDALTQDPEFFESRFEAKLKQAGTDSWDVQRHSTWDDRLPGESTVSPLNSGSDSATETLIPASITGIGFVTIEVGDYPLEVAA